MKKRVWELDAFRGLCVLGMVIVHFVYDLIDLYALVDWEYPEWFLFVMKWGGLLFILISGICATLGRRSVRRGVIVVLCGLVCTAVTYGMYRFGMAGQGLIIYFGVLHCLGTCMILWWLFKRLPTWLLAVLGIAMAVAGLYLQTRTFDTGLWLMPLGFMPDGFASSDYFPLLPNLCYFLLGGVLGRTLYRKQETLLPKVNENNPVLRFLRLCGRHSLWIYLLHQPILSGLCWLLSLLK
jgi:uncharacterized membrane protein